MSALSRIALVLVLLTRVAAAEPRVVLADPDPELRRALEASLRPWRIAVVVAPAPASPAEASARAEADTPRFVVWREGDELVVFDREAHAAERRPAHAGSFDAVGAAAAALTVKTLLRLPPPDAPPEPPRTESPTPTYRLQVGGAVRLARGLDTTTGARATIAGAIAPWAGALRFGLVADLGSAAAIDHAGFTGTWTDWAVLGFASATVVRGTWELEPAVGAGIERSALTGLDQGVSRTEHATLVLLRAGATGRRRFGRISVGAELAASVALGTPTYTKTKGMTDIFEPAPFALSLGLVVAADLGR